MNRKQVLPNANWSITVWNSLFSSRVFVSVTQQIPIEGSNSILQYVSWT